MSLLQQIKNDQLAARKARDSIKATLLTTMIGEAEGISKRDGKEMNDGEVTALVKKFLKGVDETISLVAKDNGTALDALAEKQILESYLPKQLSEAELTTVVNEIVADMRSRTTSPVNMGMVMGALKAGFDGQYDGKVASAVVKAALI